MAKDTMQVLLNNISMQFLLKNIFVSNIENFISQINLVTLIYIYI